MDLRRLPEPDCHGNYWFGEPGGAGPAILTLVSVPAVRGKYVLSLGSKGMVWEGARLAIFATPAEALKELRRRMGAK
jgi:hypothetical protein